MDKVKLLQERAVAFRDLLKQHEAKYYECGNALGKEASFYESDKPFHAAEAAFVSALEDWESQPWYQQMAKK